MVKLFFMKAVTILIIIFFVFSLPLLAQNRPYNVVFDLTSKDSSVQKAVIRWINAITESNPTAKLEVVLYGQSLDMVVDGKSFAAADVINVVNKKGVSFKVCEIAMKRHNLSKTELLPGVQTVADGIKEIVSKEGEGWGYIKAGL
jgi:intracellular sulfur oxidation DsrE/DsrF family protein